MIALLSIKAGLRAKEIANLTWAMVTDAEGQLSTAIHLRNVASKGKSGRIIPLNKELRAALQELQKQAAPISLRHHDGTFRAIFPGRDRQSVRGLVPDNRPARLLQPFRTANVYNECGAQISTVGGSLRDVQV